jgi:hypothetical protein
MRRHKSKCSLLLGADLMQVLCHLRAILSLILDAPRRLREKVTMLQNPAEFVTQCR